MNLRIALLDASVGNTPAERNFRRELDATVDAYKLSEGRLPPSVTTSDWNYDGVVISGSQTSVYDDRRWIHETTTWARKAHATDVPMLGVCWGHQFLAQALGGRVVDMRDYELGYRRVTRASDDRLFEGIPREFVSFETHSDRVAELPSDAQVLARNDYGFQAFRVENTWGVQFHPEYDRETAEWVVRGKDLPDERIRAVLDDITEAVVADAEPVKRVFDNFLAFVDDVRSARR